MLCVMEPIYGSAQTFDRLEPRQESVDPGIVRLCHDRLKVGTGLADVLFAFFVVHVFPQ
jgi:hypothetical protein